MVYVWAMTHSYVQHDSFIRVNHDSSIRATWLMHTCQPWLNYIRDLMHPYESWLTRMMPHIWRSHGSHVWMKSPWLLHICDTRHGSHIYIIYATWFIHMCEPWLVHICDMTRSYMQHDSFVCVSHDDAIIFATWLVHICDMTHSYVLAMTHWYTRQDSFRCVSHDSFMYTPWLIHVCDRTHSYVLAMPYLYVRAITFMCMWPPTHLHVHRNRNKHTEYFTGTLTHRREDMPTQRHIETQRHWDIDTQTHGHIDTRTHSHLLVYCYSFFGQQYPVL